MPWVCQIEAPINYSCSIVAPKLGEQKLHKLRCFEARAVLAWFDEYREKAAEYPAMAMVGPGDPNILL